MTDKEILHITAEYFTRKRVPAWAVGGFVRDRIMRRPFSGDIDIAIAGDTLSHGKAVARLLMASVVPLSKAFGITRIVMRNGTTIDLTKLRGRTIQDDLVKRDFTVNSIAFPLGAQDELIDPLDGVEDINSRVLRMDSKQALMEDPVRLLRAFRFAASLAFSIEKRTLCNIRELSEHLRSPASERIRDEFMKLLTSRNSLPALTAADKAGVLCGVFPELNALKGVEQPGYHHLDVFEHTLEALKQLDELKGLEEFSLTKAARAFAESKLNEKRGQYSILAHLKFVCLFHDISKPETKTEGSDGGAHFYNHEIAGAKKFSMIGKRLRFSNNEIECGVRIIRNHLRVGYMAGMKEVSKRSVLRFLRDTADNTVEVLVLSWADRLSALGPKVRKQDIEAQRKLISMLLSEYHRFATAKPLPKIINGDAVMKKFKIKPSPELGKLLEAVKEGQQLGKITTRKEAFDLIRELIVR